MSPLGVALILLVWGTLRQKRRLLWAGVLILLLASNPIVAHYMIRASEGWAERIPAEGADAADAIVVLSAGRMEAPGPAHVSEWLEANRFFGGVELFQARKAPLLVFTAPVAPWDPSAPTEGALLAQEARALGVPAGQILIAGPVFNTADEAREVSLLLRARQATTPRVLLVTSAFHMKRARRIFEESGLTVVSFPVGFMVSDGARLPGSAFVPSAGAIAHVQTAVHEGYGRLFFWLQSSVLGRSQSAAKN